MKTNRRSPVGTDGGPGPDLGPNLGIGNARGIKEGTGEGLAVGKMIERGNGIQGTLTGRIGVELTGKVVRAGMEEAWALTAPWRNGWVFDLPRAPPIQHSPSKQSIHYLWVNPFLGFSSRSITLSSLISSSGLPPSLSFLLSMQSLVSPSIQFIYAFAMRTCKICTSWLLFHLILPYISVALPLSLSVSVSVISSPPSSLVSVNLWTRLVLCQIVSISMYDFLVVVVITRVSLTLSHRRVCLRLSLICPIPVSSSLCFRCASCFVCCRYSSFIP